MKPWQYRVRRGWKLFHIFYQNWTLNMVGVCKEWRPIRGCFENIDFKNPTGVGWPLGQSLIFHRTECEQDVDAATVFCSSAHVLRAFWRSMRGEVDTGNIPWSTAVTCKAVQLIHTDSGARRDGGPWAHGPSFGESPASYAINQQHDGKDAS